MKKNSPIITINNKDEKSRLMPCLENMLQNVLNTISWIIKLEEEVRETRFHQIE